MKEMCLNEIQLASLEVLQELDTICTKNNYTYWINFGTLIGAVRHNGFIPWDDDVDISMPREDYDKLIDFLSNDYNSDKFEVHTHKNNSSYPFYISRFCDKSHTLVFEGYNYKSGCFVDIYPYDGMGGKEDGVYWKRLERKLQRIEKKLCFAEANSYLYGTTLVRKIVHFAPLIISKIIGREKLFEELDAYRKKYTWDESEYVGVICWSTGTYCYPKEWFNEIERIKFENISVNAPKEYDKILRLLYGDYMQLPPVSKRKPQHAYIAYKRDDNEENRNS